MVVVSADLHSVWLNSAALRLYGVADNESGLLREGDAFRVLGLATPSTTLFSTAGLDDAARAATARGIVGIVDYEMAWNRRPGRAGSRRGADRLRVEIGVYTEHLDRAIKEGLRTGDRLGDLLTMGNFKILIDGSLNTRTAYCWDEYAGRPGEFGLLTVEQHQLVDLMVRASRAGIEPAVHAIGDHANTIALDAFEAVGCRGRIEHAQLLATADLPRFARSESRQASQPDHAMDDRDVADRYWAGRTERAFPLRSLLDAGATVLLGSDAPVSPLDPWLTLSAAVGRARDGRNRGIRSRRSALRGDRGFRPDPHRGRPAGRPRGHRARPAGLLGRPAPRHAGLRDHARRSVHPRSRVGGSRSSIAPLPRRSSVATLEP